MGYLIYVELNIELRCYARDHWAKLISLHYIGYSSLDILTIVFNVFSCKWGVKKDLRTE